VQYNYISVYDTHIRYADVLCKSLDLIKEGLVVGQKKYLKQALNWMNVETFKIERLKTATATDHNSYH
jgi:hypothetical protein